MEFQKGIFYKTLTTGRHDDDVLLGCMEETVTRLIEADTSLRKPGILLGKIQSGKTRAFIGVIALAFDNGYDVAIVLTKGIKALAEQTIQRLRENKEKFAEIGSTVVVLSNANHIDQKAVPAILNQFMDL